MLRKPRLGRTVLAVESLESRRVLTVPDFALMDVNPASDTYQQPVSPVHFEGKVSGWYFGHAT